jgi:hypothetical protein
MFINIPKINKTDKANDKKDKENKKVKTEIRTRTGTKQKSLQTHKTHKTEITANPQNRNQNKIWH